MRLAQAQALFQALVTGEATAGARPGDVLRTLPGLGADGRLGIYADMYAARLAEALRADFPKLARALGEERFQAMARAYARGRPSRHHDLGRFGCDLAAWLRAGGAVQPRPGLDDLAALEWARAEVLVEADLEPVGWEALSRLPPKAFAVAALELVPAMRLVHLRRDAAALWSALEREEPVGEPDPTPGLVVVWRRDLQVFHALLPPDEAMALERAWAGECLNAVCACFEGDAPAEAAFAALASWLDEGWVAGVALPAS